MMSDSSTLLVGAAGYIGSNCPFDCDKIDVKTGQDFLEMAPQDYRTIIFLAAHLESTVKAFMYNELLHQWLDEWVKKFPNIHVIYASSAAVYGEGDQVHRESDFLKPINLYGESKLAGEYHVREYRHHTVLRFGNVYGQMKGQRGHGVTESFQDGQRYIYGDGEQVRDFVPVKKVWEVITYAAVKPDCWQGVFNLSLSKPVTVNEWYEKHGQADPVHVGEREGDIRISKLDNSKMLDRIKQCL